MYNDLILDDEYKLRIHSKKLASGRYQVKFFAVLHNGKELYGYLLVGAGETLKDVILQIRKRLRILDVTTDAGNFHLYQIGRTPIDHQNFLIFQ